MEQRRIAILGAGGWGLALAVLWARRGQEEITLWGHNPAHLERIAADRKNLSRLPGVELPASVRLSSDLSDCGRADLLVLVTPSTAVREIAGNLKAVLSPDSVLLSCTKGIEHGTGMRMSEILEEQLPGHPVAVLSGPNLAVEVSRGLPTATVLGCRERARAEELQQRLGGSHFRIYSSDETVGIELGGALKNVFAITAGASDGLGLGDNAKSALVTRCLAELLRLGTAMGGKAETFYGLSGAGDLIATCFSQLSRNRRVGRGTRERAHASGNNQRDGDDRGRHSHDEECLRMRPPARRGNADHRSSLRHALPGTPAAGGAPGITPARAEIRKLNSSLGSR